MLNDSRDFQFALARHLRDPHTMPLPAGVSAEQAATYERAMFKNLSDILNPAFPVTRGLLGDWAWRAAVRYFLRDCPAKAPWPRTVLLEFARFLRESPETQTLPAWLNDVSHFEWLKGAVATSALVLPQADVDAHADLMTHLVVLNPTYVEVSYDWPVDNIDLDHRPDEMQPTYVSVLRDVNGAVQVVPSNLFRAQLLALFNAGMTGHQAFTAMAVWLQHPNPEDMLRYAPDLLAQYLREGVILGGKVATGL
jgi:hypothetical protein